MKIRIFYYLALFAFVLSLLIHISTFFNVNPQKIFPAIWLFHAGIFIVFVPAVLTLNAWNQGNKDKSPFAILKIINVVPILMKVLAFVIFIYAIVNLQLSLGSANGQPQIVDGKYVLQQRGVITEYITEEEFNKYQAYQVRQFSGHWMMFYFLSATLHKATIIREKKKV
ncbi:MAG: hypothetical protein APF84_13210 [Gracilibacter sp. BRH_c7a]|nr:MAG: hypothetical protein APF84_13210 [Gracilibacter sp. BRH_c7a]